MNYLIPAAIGCSVCILLYIVYRRQMVAHRQRMIDSYQFPATIPDKIIKQYPHLSRDQANLAMDGLREYFHICNLAGRKMVSMPSQVVDVAWHEFILFTRNYERFCRRGLGRFLHHTPAEAMQSPTLAQAGIKTAWKIACARENIPPKSPDRLPVLFALDAALAIPDGFNYDLHCDPAKRDTYCAGHIGCGSCGSGCGGDSDGCGGGCGGD